MKENAGRFTRDTENGALSDPDGISEMRPVDVLSRLMAVTRLRPLQRRTIPEGCYPS